MAGNGMMITAMVFIWWFPLATQQIPSAQTWLSPQQVDKMIIKDGYQLAPHKSSTLKNYPQLSSIVRKWTSNIHGITPKMLLALLVEDINSNKKNPNARMTSWGQQRNDGRIPFSERDFTTSHLNQRSRKRSHGGKRYFETLFPLPERRTFPEVDWRGFDEDVFHESFGGFSPVKRWRRGINLD